MEIIGPIALAAVIVVLCLVPFLPISACIWGTIYKKEKGETE